MLGPDLQIVVLDMTLEEQKERVRVRHGGSEEVVDFMKVRDGGEDDKGADDKGSDYDDEDDEGADDDTVATCRQSTTCVSQRGQTSPTQRGWWSARR